MNAMENIENRIVGFEPVFAQNARLLILGTMPSVESLRQGFYYAHPRNAFWPMMAQLLGGEAQMNIEEKKRLLTSHGVALWDVAHSCVRPGSLDNAIRDAEANDFGWLFARCPHIEGILFNGATAQEMFRKMIKSAPEGCVCARMPSTSPTYTKPFEWKLEAWRRGMEWIL